MFKLVSIIAFVVLCTLIPQSEALRINGQSHLAIEIAGKILQHRMAEFDAESPEAMEFLNGLMENGDVLGGIMSGQPLSDETADWVRNYFTNSDYFRNTAIAGAAQGAGPQGVCFSGMNKKQQKKFVSLVLDEMDFKTIFLGEEGDSDQPLSDDQTDKLVSKITGDKDFNSVVKCLEKNSGEDSEVDSA